MKQDDLRGECRVLSQNWQLRQWRSTAMILPVVQQGGVNSRTGVHPLEHSGDRSWRPSTMDQNVKESVDNGVQSRRHLALSWQPGVDEGSPSSVESIAGGDLVYPSADVSLPAFQKLRGGVTNLMDLSPFSEDEDSLDPIENGSPVSHSRRRKHAAHPVAHLDASTNTNDATPDEISTHSEDYSFHRVKLLCSYGGKILPRPIDNQLRYVGGDTRLITVSRDIHYNELLQKMAELYAQAHTIKYKLPEEDLDALVSVSSNEDVANMMEEYDQLQSLESSPRLRLFLFSDMDHESVQLKESLGDQRSTEQRYVDAVNGISETASRKQTGDGGSVAVAPIVIDSLIGVGDCWGLNREQDSVPVALLAPQISQDVASLIQNVPVALPISSIPPMSAPSSAPSSPPFLPRVLKQGLIPEMRLSDMHSHAYGHQYNIVPADGVVLDGDNYGVNLAACANVHEHVCNNSDPQRRSESPKNLQHEVDLLGGHQELVARDDVRRLPEVRMPRVPSHGKFTRVSDHHSEVIPSLRLRHGYQQPQQSQQQGGWPLHSFEEQMHIYNRRVEPMQPSSDVVVQPIVPEQQLEPPHFRGSFQSLMPTPTIDQPIYRPVDHHSVGEEVFAPFGQRSISGNKMGPIGPTTISSYNIGAGSAPSSPRMNSRDVSNVHASGQPQSQLQQVLRTCAAPNYAEQHQPHGLGHHPHSDSTTRLRPATSPPRYRDHLGPKDDWLLRPLQQSVVVNADIMQQELFLYDGRNSTHRQCTEGIRRGQVPQYLGHNPFQDGLSGFSESSYSEIQDGGDARRQRERSCELSFHPSHFNSGDDLQDQNTPSVEQLSVHSRGQEKPIDWGAHQRGRDLEEIRSWRGGREQSSQNELVNEGSGADLETLGGRFLHLPDDSADILAMSDSYLHRNAGVAEPLSANNPLSRNTVTQSHVLAVCPSSLAPVVVDIPQVPLYVGRDSDSGLFGEPVPRSVESLPDLKSSPALAKVSYLPSDSTSNKLASEMDVDDSATTGAINDLVPHRSSASSTRLENTESKIISELRWAGHNDVDELRVDLLALHRSNNQDNFQQLSGSGIPEGGQSGPSSGTRMEASEEGASPGLQTDLSMTLDNGTLGKVKNNSSAYVFHNLILTDGMSPPVAQLPVSTGHAHSLPPTTSGVMSFTIPAPSVTASMQLSSPLMPSASNTSTSVGSSNIKQESNSMGSLLFMPGPIPPRISEGDISGLLGQNMDNRRNNSKIITSQFSATGHLAEDMASSVLVSSARELLAPLPSAKLQVDSKDNKWLPFPRDGTAAVSPNLTHAPTFSVSNWDSVQNLTDVDAEVVDDQSGTPDAPAVNEDLDTEHPFTLVEEEISAITPAEEPVAEPAVPILEDPKQGSSSPGTAEDAEAEAIRSGLQTILNADLEEMRELGSGTFGTVYHGKWRGTDVAIKRIKASCFAGRPAERDRLIADFWREACTLSQLHHPNVVAFYGVVRDGPGGTLATVTEYMVNGSLKQVLQKKDRTIDRRKRLLIAMDAAFGMEYLHSKNIVHFDLKCDNLLVNMRDPHRPICKVGDLGLSKVKHQTMVSGGVRGTLPWMAPELLNGSSTLVTEKVDAFSFGIVMWELLTGEEPYANMHYGAIIGGIVNNTLRPSIPSWCDPLWKSLMERCWSAEPTSRPSFSEVASELRVMATAQPKAHGGRQEVSCKSK